MRPEDLLIRTTSPVQRTAPATPWDGQALGELRRLGGHWHIPHKAIVSLGVTFPHGVCLVVLEDYVLDLIALKDCPYTT